MQNANKGKVIFTYQPERNYIFMETEINRITEIFQFTGQLLRDNYRYTFVL